MQKNLNIKSFIFLIFIFTSGICHAEKYYSCMFESSDDAAILPFDANKRYVPEKGAAFFNLLETRSDCTKQDFELSNYWGKKTAKMITFIYYFDGMKGISNSFLGTCIRTNLYTGYVDYSCYLNMK